MTFEPIISFVARDDVGWRQARNASAAQQYDLLGFDDSAQPTLLTLSKIQARDDVGWRQARSASAAQQFRRLNPTYIT